MKRESLTTILPNQKIFIILLFAALLRIIVLLLFHPWDTQVENKIILINDALGYHNLANCIVNDLSFCGDTFRTPGYPFYIAIFYVLFGTKPWVVLFSQILVNLIAIYYVFKIGEMIFSKRIGLIAATFLAIDPNSICAITLLYSDSLFVSIMLASLYYYLRGLKFGNNFDFLLSGVLLGISALVRPVAQYYSLILFLFALLWPARNLLLRFKYALLYGLAFVLIISPWLYRNYTLYDKIKLSSVQGETLLQWQVPYVKARETHQSREEIVAEFLAEAQAFGYSKDGNPFVNEEIEQKIAANYIKTHLFLSVTSLVSGIVHTYDNLDTSNIVKSLGFIPTWLANDAMETSRNEFKLIYLFFSTKSLPEIVCGLIVMTMLLVNYITFILGVNLLIKRQQLLVLVMFIISIFYFTITCGPMGLARFRLPITGFYLLIGAVYIDELLIRMSSRNSSYSIYHKEEACG